MKILKARSSHLQFSIGDRFTARTISFLNSKSVQVYNRKPKYSLCNPMNFRKKRDAISKEENRFIKLWVFWRPEIEHLRPNIVMVILSGDQIWGAIFCQGLKELKYKLARKVAFLSLALPKEQQVKNEWLITFFFK